MIIRKRREKCMLCFKPLKVGDAYILHKAYVKKIDVKKAAMSFDADDMEVVEWFCPSCFEKYLNLRKIYMAIMEKELNPKEDDD